MPAPATEISRTPQTAQPWRDTGAYILDREPELLTPADEIVWPLLPGSQEGRFMLMLSISDTGMVESVEADCAPELCEAASIHAEMTKKWRFRPGEVAGHPVSSQIRLELQVGTPPEPEEQGSGGSDSRPQLR